MSTPSVCAPHHSFAQLSLLLAVGVTLPNCCAWGLQDKLQEYERQVNELKAKLETANREKTAVESQLQRSMSDERLRPPEKVRLLQVARGAAFAAGFGSWLVRALCCCAVVVLLTARKQVSCTHTYRVQLF